MEFAYVHERSMKSCDGLTGPLLSGQSKKKKKKKKRYIKIYILKRGRINNSIYRPKHDCSKTTILKKITKNHQISQSSLFSWSTGSEQKQTKRNKTQNKTKKKRFFHFFLISVCSWVIDQIRHENHSNYVYFDKTSHKIKLIQYERENNFF